MKLQLITGAVLAALSLSSQASEQSVTNDGALNHSDTRLLRFPDIHQDNVAFVYSGDIYIANWKTGKSQRLTDHKGFETFPKFSPDGSKIAFSAELSGSRQVYVMDIDGSNLKQLTFYNDVGPMPPRGGFDNRVMDWTPDGKHVLIRANRTPYGKRMGRPYLVPVDGGLETPLAVTETGGGMLSPDGTKYLYTPIDREFRTWKRYRGGRAQDVWTYDLVNNVSKRLTTHKGTDNQPVWVGDDILFTSDRDYTLNLYKYVEGGEPQKVTDHKEFDVLFASAGPTAVVYENGGYLYRYDPAANTPQKLSISIEGTRIYRQPSYKNAARNIESFDLSHDGKRAVFGARGEIFTVPAKNGEVRNISKSSGVREINVTWSPNGKYIAYYSDVSGEYELYIREQNGKGKPVQITDNGTIWRFTPVWSPDSKRILFADKNQTLYHVDIKKKKQVKIDRSEYNDIVEYIWSPDSKQVVYVKNNPNSYSSLWHYDLKSRKKTRLTDDTTSEFSPAFSPDGSQLYFASNRDFNLAFSDYEFNYLYNKATRVYAASVSEDGPTLFMPTSDEVAIKSDKKKGKKDKKDDEKSAISFDTEGFADRVISLGAPAGSYRNLQGVKDGVLAQSGGKLVLISSKKAEKPKTVMAGVQNYKVVGGGDKVMVQSGANYGVISPKPDQKLKDKLNVKGMEVKVNPADEWIQIYNEGWRTLRDWFYDPGMHGMDWVGIRERYLPMAQAAAHRSDIDYVLSEIAGELNAGHIYVQSGDMPKVKRRETGLIGAEISAHKSGYFRIEKIFNGENWHDNFRSPLDQPGVKAKEGNYIIAVNGVPTTSVYNFYELMENTKGKAVELTLNRKPTKKGSWTTVIKPTASELGLRYLDWVESRRAMVEKLSDGRIGYFHLPNTAVEGNRELNKRFMPQATKDALIIDDRYNGGGFIPERMIEILSRKTLNSWVTRGTKPNPTPLFAHDGPKAMIINGYSSSGGDALPYYFRQNGLGKLIGTRTWGGLIGISGNPGLVDGGIVIAATFRIIDNDGNWIIENEGVSPDIEVRDLPELLMKGQDPSLERAVKELMKDLPANPRSKLKVPPAPTTFIE